MLSCVCTHKKTTYTYSYTHLKTHESRGLSVSSDRVFVFLCV